MNNIANGMNKHTSNKYSINMKIIKLTAREYYTFKDIVKDKFPYEATPVKGVVFIEAKEKDLVDLGY